MQQKIPLTTRRWHEYVTNHKRQWKKAGNSSSVDVSFCTRLLEGTLITTNCCGRCMVLSKLQLVNRTA